MNIDPKTLMWWERDEREPVVTAYPAVIEYLGYEPWPEPHDDPAQLLAERRRRGLTRADAAAVIGVDEGTLWWWESGKRVPTNQATKEKLARFLAGESLS